MSAPTRLQPTVPAFHVNTPASSRRVLEKIFPEGPSQEWASSYEALAGEVHADLFHQDLLALGRDLEDQDILGPAVKIYQYLVQHFPEGELGKSAAFQLSGLLGTGDAGSRLEFQSKRFLSAATDWKMIVPMIAASSVYPLGGRAVWTSLTRSSSGAWWSQGMGAKALSSGAGFLAETTVFSLGSRGLHAAMGAEVSWDLKSVGSDWLSAGLTLGILKGSGQVGRYGMQRYVMAKGEAGLLAMDRMVLGLLGHGSGYLGLVGAHQLESSLGWSEGGGSPWLDGMSAYLSLSLGAKLGYGILGKGFTNWQQNLSERPATQVTRKESSSMDWVGALVPGGPMMLAMSWLSWARRGKSWMQWALAKWGNVPRTGKEVQDSLPAYEWNLWISNYQSRFLNNRMKELQRRRSNVVLIPADSTVALLKSQADFQNIPWELKVWREFKNATSNEIEGWLDRMYPWHRGQLEGSHGYEHQTEFIAQTQWRRGTRRLLDIFRSPELLDQQKTRLMQQIADLKLTDAVPDLRKILFNGNENHRVRMEAAETLSILGDDSVVWSGIQLLQRAHVHFDDYLYQARLKLLGVISGKGIPEGGRIIVPLLEDILTFHPTFRMLRHHPKLLDVDLQSRKSQMYLTNRRIYEILFEKFKVFEGIPRHQIAIGEFLLQLGRGDRLEKEYSNEWSHGPPSKSLNTNLASLTLWAQTEAGHRALIHLESLLENPEYKDEITDYALEIARIYDHLGAGSTARTWAKQAITHPSWKRSVQAFHLLDRIEATNQRSAKSEDFGKALNASVLYPAPQENFSYALGTVHLDTKRVMHLTGESYSWGERKFGRWEVQKIIVRGERQFLELRRIQSGEEKAWPEILQFEVADLEAPFKTGQEVWFVPPNAVSGGIDLIKNPAAAYAQRNRGEKFVEETLKNQFWLMPFVNEEILQLFPGAKSHHEVVKFETVDPPEWENPIIQITTRGMDPIWKKSEAIYQFKIPFYFGEQLGLFPKKKFMEPWLVTENFHNKLVLIPDMLPKEAKPLAIVNHFHESNRGTESLPAEVDSDNWRLENRPQSPSAPETRDPTERKFAFMVMRELGPSGSRPQVFWIYPEDQLLNSEAKFVYPATVRQVQPVESAGSSTREALIHFPIRERRPGNMPWVRFQFEDSDEFPFRVGEKIYFVKGANGGSGMGEVNDGVYEREAIFRNNRGKYFQLLGVQIHQGRGVYFPTAPVERMEWREPSIFSRKKLGAPESEDRNINLLLWTRDFTGKSQFYRLQSTPEVLKQMGIELLPDQKVAMPEKWAFMVRSLRELQEQYQEDLSELLRHYRRGSTHLSKEIWAAVIKLKEWAHIEGKDTSGLDHLLNESGIPVSPKINNPIESKALDYHPVSANKQVAWIGTTLKKQAVTLVLADAPEAPSSAPTWVVVRVMADKVILGRKASNPGERPKGFLHVQLSKVDQKQFAPGQRYKVIHHVQGAAGKPALPANRPGNLYLQGSDGTDYHLKLRKISEGVSGQEFLIFQDIIDFRNQGEDPFRASGKTFRVTFARGHLGDLVRQKSAGQFLQTISFDLTEAEAQMMELENLESVQYTMEPYQPPNTGAMRPPVVIKEKPTQRITLVETEDPSLKKTFNAHGSLVRHSDNSLLWKLNPHRAMNLFGRGSALVDELGVEGYLVLTRAKGISLQHAQVFYLGDGRFSIRNTSSRGLKILRPDDQNIKLTQYGEEVELFPGDRLEIGTQSVDLEFPSEFPPQPTEFSRERRALHGQMEVNNSSNQPSTYNTPVPKELTLFPESTPEQNVIYLGRLQDTTGTGHYPVVNLNDPVVSLNHVEVKRLKNGTLQVTPLELGGPGRENLGQYGTWVRRMGVWERQAVGKSFALYPGQRLALGSVAFDDAVGNSKEAKANLSMALIFEVGPQGRTLKQVDDTGE